jgi:chromosome segregation ATPase
MRKGITQEQVNVAADALVAAGDKPTVEKIRQALGTGSPNTVTRMLDAWRGTLAQRLQEVIKLPEVPVEAGQAFAEVWRLAVVHAETLARATLMEEQNALFAAQTSLTQERKLWEIALAEAQANATEGAAKLAQAEVQLNERQSLMAQLRVQTDDLRSQRDRLQGQLEHMRAELEALRVTYSASQEHIRTVEDRAHQQVDLARQDIKALQQRLDREQRDHAGAQSHRVKQCDELRIALRTSEQALARETGRAAALEVALSAHLKANLPRKRTAKKTAPIRKAKGTNAKRSLKR